MTSWVYLFSKFTPEMLLFEALVIFVLTGIIAGVFLLRRKRFGVLTENVPAGVLKHYLSEVMKNARTIQGQLFGEVALQGAEGWTPTVTVSNQTDPALLQKLTQLETQILEKDKSMQLLSKEKERIEQDLARAKVAAIQKSSTPSAAVDNSELYQLREKTQVLEDRLAEYSVIEDDLANLKRLQQENLLLRNILTTNKIQVPQAAAGSATQTKTTAAPAAAASPAQAQLQPEKEAEAAPTETQAESGASTGAEPASADPSFENLVNQVEESLQSPPTPETVKAAPAAPAAPAAASPTAPSAEDKSDAELVAEFEKMLKS